MHPRQTNGQSGAGMIRLYEALALSSVFQRLERRAAEVTDAAHTRSVGAAAGAAAKRLPDGNHGDNNLPTGSRL